MQSIKEMLEKIKPLYTLLLYLVLAALFFALGRLSVLEERHSPVRLDSALQDSSTESETTQSAIAIGATNKEVVASKNGTKYYFPWCGGSKNIKAENKIIFASPEVAEAHGYSKAANCKGL